jgi:hypothetical protein
VLVLDDVFFHSSRELVRWLTEVCSTARRSFYSREMSDIEMAWVLKKSQVITLIMPAEYKCPPFRSERRGITRWQHSRRSSLLLLVIYCGALVFLALCIGSVDCDRAALAIGRDHHVGRENNLTAFF